MLKKNDLAKQFEIVVQQEIKNYQNSHNGVLETLRSLQDQISRLEQEVKNNQASNHSELQKTNNNFKEFSEETDNTQCNINFHIRRIDNQLKDASEKIYQDSQNRNLINNKLYLCDLGISECNKRINGNTKELNEQNEKLVQNHNSLLSQTKKMNEKIKEDILSQPSDIHLYKQQIEEKIYSHAVDVEGLLKEIRISNKDRYVLEKKIEHLYILVERLQKKGVVE